jgi:hypothetical protein
MGFFKKVSPVQREEYRKCTYQQFNVNTLISESADIFMFLNKTN